MSDTEYLLPDHWIRHHDLSSWRVMYDSYVGRVVQLVLDCGAKTVIEVGCGDGWNCGQLTNSGV